MFPLEGVFYLEASGSFFQLPLFLFLLNIIQSETEPRCAVNVSGFALMLGGILASIKV